MDELFFQDHTFIPGETFIFSDENHHHAIRVLRHLPGDEVWFTDGKGNLVKVLLETSGKKGSSGKILTVTAEPNPLKSRLHLAAGLLKIPSRMDWLIEKGAELSLSSFIPLETHRTVKSAINPDRWEKLSVSALKQSKNVRKVKIEPKVTFQNALSRVAPGCLVLVAHEVRTHSSRLISELDISDFDDIYLFLGPEGGFSPEEIELAVQSKAQLIWLGSQRLRTETAALVGLSALHQKLIHY